ncbi:DNA topology modulation protein [Alicyclobacillus ferrooxydans]
MIIGSGGAGKSTLAREMGEITGIPVCHLDAAYWNPGWVATSEEEWDDTVKDLISADEWILDGNYSRTLDVRAARADTIIFLDMPSWITVYRIVKRRIRYHGQTRPDLREGCTEKLDWEFVRWVWSYRNRRRPGIMDKLTALSKEKRIIILGSPKQVRQFVRQIRALSNNHT